MVVSTLWSWCAAWYVARCAWCGLAAVSVSPCWFTLVWYGVCVGLVSNVVPANPRLAHKDSSNDPHIIHHLGPTDPSGHRRPRWPTKKVELYSGWELDVDNLPKQRIWIPSPADSPVCMECSGATSSVGRRRIHITHVWPQFNMSTL